MMSSLFCEADASVKVLDCLLSAVSSGKVTGAVAKSAETKLVMRTSSGLQGRLQQPAVLVA
jgi:hypothetical protein